MLERQESFYDKLKKRIIPEGQDSETIISYEDLPEAIKSEVDNYLSKHKNASDSGMLRGYKIYKSGSLDGYEYKISATVTRHDNGRPIGDFTETHVIFTDKNGNVTTKGHKAEETH